MKPSPLDLKREDFPDLNGPRIEKLIRALNTSVGSITKILAGGLVFSDNARAFVKEVVLSTRDEWIPLTLENSWTQNGSVVPAYHMDSAGNVHFRGTIGGGGFSTTNRFGGVQADYAPEYVESCIIESHNAGGSHFPAYVEVGTDGSLYPHAGTTSTYLELNGITYHADNKDAPNPCFPLRIRNELGSRPIGIVVLAATDITNRTERPIRVSNPAWSTERSDILIHNIAGVPGSAKVRITLLVIGG